MFKLARTLLTSNSWVVTNGGNKPCMPSFWRSSMVNESPYNLNLKIQLSYLVNIIWINFIPYWFESFLIYSSLIKQTENIVKSK